MPISRAHLVQLVVKCKVNGQDYRNVLHFTTDEVVSDATRRDLLLALAVAYIACFVDVLIPVLPNTFRFDSVTVKELHPMQSDEYEQLVEGANQLGTAGGQSGPSFVATLIRLRTGKAGRTHRGRMFLPPPTELQMNADTIGDGFYDALVAFAACLAGKFIGAGASTVWRLCVLSKKGVGTPANYALATDTDVIDLLPQRELAVMRRRRLGHGG